MRKMFSFLAGTMAGALVAGVAVLLLTPYAGEDVRGRMQSRFEALIDEGKRAAAARRAEMEAQLEQFKHGTPTVEL